MTVERAALGVALAAATGRPETELAGVIEALRPASFEDDEGSLDAAAVARFASTLGGAARNPDVVMEAMSRQRQVPRGNQGSAMADRRAEVRDAMTHVVKRTTPDDVDTAITYDRIQGRASASAMATRRRATRDRLTRKASA